MKRVEQNLGISNLMAKNAPSMYVCLPVGPQSAHPGLSRQSNYSLLRVMLELAP